MYLSTVEILGFKSFAQKINVKFDAGLTAIVGPNGCGKTNIVDAIRWALGEQKTSVLRSDKMENVIFNGTKNRKPLGMTEVSITIQNNRQILPSEYTEVTITRRLYRNGDSEYFLNRVPCRLKDISDLFADTGMGSDAYSVIELKMIEEILSDNKNDQRKLIEEAAGVTKYKQRRKQAFKKLETTTVDLNRVQDIVSEVEKKTASLERQAKKAEQAVRVKQELFDLEWKHTSVLLKRILDKLQDIDTNLSSMESGKTEILDTLEITDKELQEARMGLAELNTSKNDLQKKIRNALELLNDTEKHTTENKQRKILLHSHIEQSKVEASEVDAKGKELDAHIAQFYSDVEEIQKGIDEFRKNYEENIYELSEKEKSIKEKRTIIQNSQNLFLNVSKEISSFEAHIQSHHGRIKTLESEQQKLHVAIQSIEQAIEQKKSTHHQLQEAYTQLIERQTNEEQHVEQKRQQKTELQEKISSQKEKIIQLVSKEEIKKNRLQYIESLLESFEGLPSGIKYLETVETNHGIGALSDLITTTDTYQVAVEVALGETLKYYVSRTEREAKEAIALLRNHAKGKVTFIVLDKIRSLRDAQNEGFDFLPKFIKSFFEKKRIDDAMLVPISSVIQCDAELKNAIRIITDNVYLAATMEEGEMLAQKHPLSEFVTLSGERITTHGFLYGGSDSQSPEGRIGKKEEAKKIHTELDEYRKDIEQNQTILSELEIIFSQINDAELEKSIKNIREEVSRSEKNINQTQFEIEKLHGDNQRTTESIEKNNAEMISIQNSINEMEHKKQEVVATSQSHEHNLTTVKGDIQAAEVEIETFSADVRKKQIILREKEFGLEKVKDLLMQAETDKRKGVQRVQHLEKEIKSAHDEMFVLDGEIETMAENVKTLQNQKEDFSKQLTEKDALEIVLTPKIHEQEITYRDLQKKKEAVMKSYSDIQQTKMELDFRREKLINHITESYQQELIPATEEPENFDEPANEQEITQLKNRLRNIGAVNALALEEYDEEKKRLDFLIAQRDDLIQAEGQLQTTILEINKTAKEQFSKVFEQIRVNFIMLFRELFNEGDEADITLADPNDPLESEIEIVAKPKGKRPQSILLLSGGEKTLTAIALLFAIYLVKPSPFCILDEVDAPLDDANVSRFIKLIRKFETNTQFVIVTHNKRTMEAAGTLYGVTMEEEGISKLVSVKFNESPVVAQ